MRRKLTSTEAASELKQSHFLQYAVVEGLLAVYGFDRNGLERERRDWIGKPLPTPTPVPTPTPAPQSASAKTAERSPLEALVELLTKILRWIVLPKGREGITAPTRQAVGAFLFPPHNRLLPSARFPPILRAHFIR